MNNDAHMDRVFGIASRNDREETDMHSMASFARGDSAYQFGAPLFGASLRPLAPPPIDPSTLPPHATLAELNALLAKHPDAIETRPNKLVAALEAFVGANEKPASSPNFVAGTIDDASAVVALLRSALDGGGDVHEHIAELVLRLLKILSRKEANRLALGSRAMPALCAALAAPPSEAIASEACNVLLNVCYEKECVAHALRCGALPHVVALLSSDIAQLQATAAGALQSIAYQKAGREAANDAAAGPPLVPLLSSTDERVSARAAGALHNLSSDARVLTALREAGAIAPLVRLLRANAAGPCASAAGALQNMAREPLAREELQELGACVPLSDLLFANDEGCRQCAVGALLNLVGPELGEETDANDKRVLFKRALGMAVAMGELHARTAPDAPADISWVRLGDGRQVSGDRPRAQAGETSVADAGRPSAAERPRAT